MRKPSAEAIAAEWEVVALYGLQQIGEISATEDKDCVGQLDVLFRPTVGGRQVLVEVTAVSDDGLHSRNPVDSFMDAVNRCFAKRGLLKCGGLSYRIGHHDGTEGVILGVPALADIGTFINSPEFQSFLNSVLRTPHSPARMEFKGRNIESSIEYVPGGKTVIAGYRSYRGISHRTRNHVYSRLRKKAEQAKRAISDLPVVVVLCDAGCHALSSKMIESSQSTTNEVIDLFLNGRAHIQSGPWIIQPGEPRGSRRIAAAVIVSPHERSMLFSRQRTRELRARAIMSEDSALDHALAETVVTVARFIDHAPPVAKMPVNARLVHRHPWHYGGGTISSGANRLKVKFSLLAFQQLLCGKLQFDELRNDHPEAFRALANATAQGFMISNIRVEQCPDEDDDWIEIEMTETSPSRLFFQNPSSEESG